MARPIADAKLRALRDALERDGRVAFKNGSEVELDHTEVRKGFDEAPTVIPFVTVTRTSAPGGATRHGFDDAGLRRAYSMALYGPEAHPQPSGDPAAFGDDPPF